MGNSYKIAFKGLKPGNHSFEFRVDDSFFSRRPEGGLTAGSVGIEADLLKNENMMILDIRMNGSVTASCDRCLEDCELPVNYKGRLTVKFSNEEIPFDGDIMWLNPSEHELDLEQYLYESIILSLPYSRVHPEDVHGTPLCNPAMLERFRIVTQEEFDTIESPERAAEDDPRWERLKELQATDRPEDEKR